LLTNQQYSTIEDHFDKSVELEFALQQKGKTDLLNLVQGISNMANIHYIRQKEPKGLGHAIYCAKSFIGNEPFAVLLGDDLVRANKPCLKQLIEMYEKYNTTILGVQEVPQNDVNKYGIVAGNLIDNRVYKINSLVEKPSVNNAPSNIAVLGRYIITPEIFDILERTPPGTGEEIQITDALKELCNYQLIYAYIFEGKRYDAGDKLGYLQATVEFAMEREDLT